jgi:hypothetical protein
VSADHDPPASGRYRRGSEIARGGMGRVVEAEDAVLGRTVALKETLEDDDDARRRFEREVRITARLEHPSIVPVYDAGRTSGGLPFYVMRRLTGRPLDQIIRAAPTLDERLTYVPNVLAVLDALGHAHRRGIIHRDLKPANMLIGELGETVVIDWGLAKVLGEIEPDPDNVGTAAGATSAPPLPALGDALTDRTVAGTVVGTPGFMPPEQAVGDDVDARSDVYALGATLYHLLAGDPPYAGSRPSEILDRTVAEPPPPLTERVPGVPPDLVTIVDKAMAAAPEARYRDAAAMGEDLRRFLSGQLVAAHHYSSRERVIRYVRRHRTVLGVLALAAAVLAVVGTLSLRRIIADRDRIATARAAAEAGRTDAERKSAELRRLADGLIIGQARSSLTVDPSLAVAQLKRLAPDSPRWPEARAIAAEARSRGITYALPGHAGSTYLLEVAPDGRRVLSAGATDGLLRVHDLVARTTVTIDDHYEATAGPIRWWGGELMRFVRAAQRVELLDPATGRVLDTVSPTAAWAETSHAGALVWVETDGAIKLRRTRNAAIEDVGSAPGAHWVGLSPQATFVLADAGGDRLALFQRAGTGWESRGVIDSLWGVQFAFDDSRYAYGVDGALIEVDVGTTPPVRTRHPTRDLVTMFGYAGRTLWSAQSTRGAIQVSAHVPDGPFRDPGMARMKAINGPAYPLSDGLVGFAGTADTGQVVLARAGGDVLELHSSDVVSRIAARAGSQFLVGAAGNKLLVWDLDEILPDSLDLHSAISILYPAGEHMILASDTSSWWAIDTRTGRARGHRFPSQKNFYVLFQPGTLIHYLVGDELEVIDVATWDTRRVRTTAELAMPLDAERVAISEPDGTLRVIRYDTGAATDLGALGAPPEAAGVLGGIAYFVGGVHAVRTDGAALETAAFAGHIDGADLAADGTLFLVVDNVVHRWPRGGAPVQLIAPALAITGLIALGPTDLVAIANDQSMWRLDPDTGDVSQILPALDSVPQVSRDRRCAVAVRAGAAVVADLVGRTWWRLASSGVTNAAPGATCDAIYTTGWNTQIRVWNVEVPYGDALRTWLDQRTNAGPSETHGVIEWVLPP